MKFTRRELSKRLRRATKILHKLGYNVEASLEELLEHLSAPQVHGIDIGVILSNDYLLAREILVMDWLREHGIELTKLGYLLNQKIVLKGFIEVTYDLVEKLCSEDNLECIHLLTSIEHLIEDDKLPPEFRDKLIELYNKYYNQVLSRVSGIPLLIEV
ncbi:MAG: hypothetical protein ABWW65_03765 [Thermoprotei archaeon]